MTTPNSSSSFAIATRTSLALSLLALASCGGGGGPTDLLGSSGGTIVGNVQLAGSNQGLGGPPGGPESEAEPNDHAFQVQDLGDLDESDLAVRGRLAGATDRADFFRFGSRRGGLVQVATTAEHAGTTRTVFLVRGGTGQPEAIHRGPAATDVCVSTEAGDHLIVALENPAAPSAWTLRVRVADSTAKPTPVVAIEPGAADDTLLPPALKVAAGQLILRFAEDEALGLHEAGRAGLEIVRSGGGYHLVRAARTAAVRADRSGHVALADLAFRLRRNLPKVASVEPNYLVHTAKEPNDTHYQNGQGAWHHKLCNTPAAWDKTTGNGVVVAVIDTGVLFEHEDLKPNLLRDGYDFVDQDNDPSDPVRFGGSYHGSHVAGIIAAATDNGMGVAGVCWNAKILPIRVLGTNGTGTTFDIAQAVLYAAGLTNQSGALPQTKAKVINLSLGGGGFNSVMADAMQKAQAAGCIVLAAAGNEFQKGNPVSFPANYEGVIGVGSVGPTKNRAVYSNTGAYVDVAAPGGDQTNGQSDGILSTVAVESNGQYFSGYEFMQGTSMACPFAAGVVALMLSTSPNLTTADVMNVFQATAEDLGAPGRDDAYGVGLIDVAKAVQGSNLPIRVSSTNVAFTAQVDAQTVKIESGSGNPMPLSLDTNGTASWLSATLTGTTTPADLQLRLDRSKLPAGKQTTTLKIVSGSVSVAITVTAGDSNNNQPTPRASVWVVDGNQQIIATTQVDGQGNFNLTEVPAGSYFFYFGVDTNQNGTLGDRGDWAGPALTVAFSDGDTLNVGNLTANRVQ